MSPLNHTKIPPLQLKTLELTHYRRFREFAISFEDRLTVLVGRNGSGKTSVLDAVATGLGFFLSRLPGVSGISTRKGDLHIESSGSKPRQAPYLRLRWKTTSDLIWDYTVPRDRTAKTLSHIPDPGYRFKGLYDYADRYTDALNDGDPVELPVIAYYGAGRGVFDLPQRDRQSALVKDRKRLNTYDVALSSRANFKSFLRYFTDLEFYELKKKNELRSFDYELPELRAIRRAVAQMMPGFSNPRVASPIGLEVDCCLDDASPSRSTPLRIEQLSDGYRTTLAMVMDIAARMAEANPESPDPLQTSGIVLIDEIELHLHPGWQQQILGDLQATFPNVQFIVTTHSPQVISTVPPQCLRVLDWQKGEPRLLPVDFAQGAEAQQMLEDVLGVQPRAIQLDVVRDLQHYQELVEADQWDSEEAQQLWQRLQAWGGEHDPELGRLAMDVRLRRFDRQTAR